jgi:hypothetical protein
MTVRGRCIFAAEGIAALPLLRWFTRKNKEAPPYVWRRHYLCVKSYPFADQLQHRESYTFELRGKNEYRPKNNN